MTLTERSSARLQIGRVVIFMVQIIRLHLAPFLALSLFVVGIPGAVLRYQEDAYPDANMFWDLPVAIPFAAFVIAYSLLEAVITRMIVPDGAGQYTSLARSIEIVIRDIPLLSAIGLISTVLVLIGFFLLIVPGLILGAFLSVLIPVRTIEQTGFVRTFVRGIALTKGHRWAILILLTGSFALQISATLVTNLVMGDPIFAGYSSEQQTGGAAAIIASVLSVSLLSVIGSTGAAVVYCELRRIKDGPGPAALASEFD